MDETPGIRARPIERYDLSTTVYFEDVPTPLVGQPTSRQGKFLGKYRSVQKGGSGDSCYDEIHDLGVRKDMVQTGVQYWD